jgi:hypothetical protein
MRTLITTGTLTALTLAGAITLNAQTPQAPPPNPSAVPQADRPASDTQRASGNADQAITIAGCLKEEKDVPGLKPSVAEKAGVTDDYVLTNVKIAPGSAVSGIGVGPMYEIEGIAEADLKKHVGHQVELMGHIVPPSAGAAASITDAPDFKATSLKMVAATCPAAQ